METTRKPAPIVKCQYCKWQGSSRGLFTHVRLSHPAISEVPPNSKRVHPLNILSSTIKKPIKPAFVGRITKDNYGALLINAFMELVQDQKFHEILKREGVNSKRVNSALGRINE